MPPWTIQPCHVYDASALARNNMCAFWTDPTWILMWPKVITEAFLIEQCMKRMPRNMLRNRELLRHQKAVDPVTGAVLGYARWVLPASHALTLAPGGGPEWVEAQVPEVSVKERKAFEQAANTAWWKTRPEMDSLDPKLFEVIRRVLAEKDYMRLDYLAVHPENKGKGVATALVESGIRQARNIGVDIFVLAFKAALGVYLRLGFIEIERIIQDDSVYGGTGEYGAYFLVYKVNKTPL